MNAPTPSGFQKSDTTDGITLWRFSIVNAVQADPSNAAIFLSYINVSDKGRSVIQFDAPNHSDRFHVCFAQRHGSRTH